MTRPSLFPGFIKLTYTSNGHTHHQVSPIGADPTPVGDSFTIPTRSGSPVDWKTAVDNWVAVYKGMLDTTASIDLAELYNFEAEPAPADFLAAYEVGVAGTHAGSPRDWVQEVFPMKGVGGNQLRITMLEGTQEEDIHEPYVSLTAAEKAIVDFVLSSSDWIVARGGTFPTVSLGAITKTNDQLRKRYFNP